MKAVKNFFTDFILFFISIMFTVLCSLIELVHSTYYTIHRFIKNVITPFIIELGYDCYYVLLVLTQGYYDVMSSLCLRLSKMFLSYSQHCHNRSEELIEKTWPQ